MRRIGRRTWKWIQPVIAALLVGTLLAETRPVVEVGGRIVRCPVETMSRVLAASGAPEGVLTGEQSRTVLGGLEAARAEFLDRPLVVTFSGVAAETKSVREFRYPVKFEEDSRTGRRVPTAFATRDVGVTVRYTPVVLSDGEVALTIGAEWVRLRGFRDGDAGERQPVFSKSEAVEQARSSDGGTVVTRFSPDAIEGEAAAADDGAAATFLLSTARIVSDTDGGKEP